LFYDIQKIAETEDELRRQGDTLGLAPAPPQGFLSIFDKVEDVILTGKKAQDYVSRNRLSENPDLQAVLQSLIPNEEDRRNLRLTPKIVDFVYYGSFLGEGTAELALQMWFNGGRGVTAIDQHDLVSILSKSAGIEMPKDGFAGNPLETANAFLFSGGDGQSFGALGTSYNLARNASAVPMFLRDKDTTSDDSLDWWEWAEESKKKFQLAQAQLIPQVTRLACDFQLQSFYPSLCLSAVRYLTVKSKLPSVDEPANPEQSRMEELARIEFEVVANIAGEFIKSHASYESFKTMVELAEKDERMATDEFQSPELAILNRRYKMPLFASANFLLQDFDAKELGLPQKSEIITLPSTEAAVETKGLEEERQSSIILENATSETPVSGKEGAEDDENVLSFGGIEETEKEPLRYLETSFLPFRHKYTSMTNENIGNAPGIIGEVIDKIQELKEEFKRIAGKFSVETSSNFLQLLENPGDWHQFNQGRIRDEDFAEAKRLVEDHILPFLDKANKPKISGIPLSLTYKIPDLIKLDKFIGKPKAPIIFEGFTETYIEVGDAPTEPKELEKFSGVIQKKNVELSNDVPPSGFRGWFSKVTARLRRPPASGKWYPVKRVTDNNDKRNFYCWFLAEVWRLILWYHVMMSVDLDAMSILVDRHKTETGKNPSLAAVLGEYLGHLEKDSMPVVEETDNDKAARIENEKRINILLKLHEDTAKFVAIRQLEWASFSPLFRFKYIATTTEGQNRVTIFLQTCQMLYWSLPSIVKRFNPYNPLKDRAVARFKQEQEEKARVEKEAAAAAKQKEGVSASVSTTEAFAEAVRLTPSPSNALVAVPNQPSQINPQEVLPSESQQQEETPFAPIEKISVPATPLPSENATLPATPLTMTLTPLSPEDLERRQYPDFYRPSISTSFSFFNWQFSLPSLQTPARLTQIKQDFPPTVIDEFSKHNLGHWVTNTGNDTTTSTLVQKNTPLYDKMTELKDPANLKTLEAAKNTYSLTKFIEERYPPEAAKIAIKEIRAPLEAINHPDPVAKPNALVPGYDEQVQEAWSKSEEIASSIILKREEEVSNEIRERERELESQRRATRAEARRAETRLEMQKQADKARQDADLLTERQRIAQTIEEERKADREAEEDRLKFAEEQSKLKKAQMKEKDLVAAKAAAAKEGQDLVQKEMEKDFETIQSEAAPFFNIFRTARAMKDVMKKSPGALSAGLDFFSRNYARMEPLLSPVRHSPLILQPIKHMVGSKEFLAWDDFVHSALSGVTTTDTLLAVIPFARTTFRYLASVYRGADIADISEINPQELKLEEEYLNLLKSEEDFDANREVRMKDISTGELKLRLLQMAIPQVLRAKKRSELAQWTEIGVQIGARCTIPFGLGYAWTQASSFASRNLPAYVLIGAIIVYAMLYLMSISYTWKSVTGPMGAFALGTRKLTKGLTQGISKMFDSSDLDSKALTDAIQERYTEMLEKREELSELREAAKELSKSLEREVASVPVPAAAAAAAVPPIILASVIVPSPELQKLNMEAKILLHRKQAELNAAIKEMDKGIKEMEFVKFQEREDAQEKIEEERNYQLLVAALQRDDHILGIPTSMSTEAAEAEKQKIFQEYSIAKLKIEQEAKDKIKDLITKYDNEIKIEREFITQHNEEGIVALRELVAALQPSSLPE